MSQAYPNFGDRLDSFISNFPEFEGDGILYVSGDLQKYNYHVIAATGHAGHLHVEVTIDGQSWHRAAVLLVDDVTANHLSLSIPADSMGLLHGKFRKLRVKSFGEVTLSGAHGWV